MHHWLEMLKFHQLVTLIQVDIDFQLKSLWEEEDSGHWLDTGLFEIR